MSAAFPYQWRLHTVQQLTCVRCGYRAQADGSWCTKVHQASGHLDMIFQGIVPWATPCSKESL